MATAAETDPLLPATAAAAAAAAAAAETDGLLSSGKQSTTKTTQPQRAEETKEVAAKIMCAIFVMYVLLFLLVFGLVHRFGVAREPRRPYDYDPVQYTVTIAAVYGLDHAAMDLLRRQQQHHHLPSPAPAATLRAIDVAFNLTLGVASPRTAARRECVRAGTTVEVSYLRSGVPVAAGRAPAFCVEVGERREVGSVVAWGDGVRLPGFVLDGLAADALRAGAPEFGVELVAPVVPHCAGGGQGLCSADVDVISCWAKAGGGPAPCSVETRTVSVPLVPRLGLGSTTRVLDS